MLEQAILREQFESLLAKELEAAELYEHLAARTADAGVRREIEHLCREKCRHIRLAQRLIEIVD